MNRRTFLAATASAAALAVVPGTLAAQAMGTTTPGAFWGVCNTDNLDSNYWTYLPALETKLGRRFAAFRRNGITGADDLASYDKSFDHGAHWGYANGKDYNVCGGLWPTTAKGTYDSFYVGYFKHMLADPRWTNANPFHFSFHHEQYVTSECGGTECGTAGDYIAAFRHVRGIMDSVGAHVSKGGNMQMCWTPHWLQFAHDPVYGTGGGSTAVKPFVVSKLDPGAAYYDLVGQDVYCTTKANFTAAQQWTAIHKFALAQGKPFFTGETGVAGSDAKVVAYLKGLNTLLKGWGAGIGPGQVAAINWTSRVAVGGDYRMDASPVRLAQYKAMALDPFYGGAV